uniref:Uncharacterized protein n=1 Tax=Ascaris lumbricoides TaxID=6252 RepID=A0A9J2PHF9_ASCLU
LIEEDIRVANRSSLSQLVKRFAGHKQTLSVCAKEIIQLEINYSCVVQGNDDHMWLCWGVKVTSGVIF